MAHLDTPVLHVCLVGPRSGHREFLERAMDITPHARRALLTTYADTDAAVRAINVVDVDHYLLKPGDPPLEEQ